MMTARRGKNEVEAAPLDASASDFGAEHRVLEQLVQGIFPPLDRQLLALNHHRLAGLSCGNQSPFGANEVLIEDKASGTQLIHKLITNGCRSVTRYHPTCDKIVHLLGQHGRMFARYADT
jgi:hypothetical protein